MKSVNNLLCWWYCSSNTTSSSSSSSWSCTSSCSSTTAKVLHASDRLGLTHQVDSIEQCWNIKGWSFIYTLTGAFTPCHKSMSVKGSLHLQSSFENHFIFPGAFEEFGPKPDFFFFLYTPDRGEIKAEKDPVKPMQIGTQAGTAGRTITRPATDSVPSLSHAH